MQANDLVRLRHMLDSGREADPATVTIGPLAEVPAPK